MWGGSQTQWADRQDLGATLFALDDTVEEREWGSVHAEVGTTVSALTAVLGSLRDVVAPVG